MLRTAQRDLSLPALGRERRGAARGGGGRPAVAVALRVPGRDLLVLRAGRPGGHGRHRELGSTDVVHRWWVPGLGGKFDAVPGQSNQTWFKAADTGVFDGQSYALLGASYAVMRTRVRVVSVEEYEAWLDEQAAGIQEAETLVQEQIEAETELANPSGVEPQPAEELGGSAQATGDSGGAPGGAGGSRARSERRPRHRPAAARAGRRLGPGRALGLGDPRHQLDHKDVGRLFICGSLAFLALGLVGFFLMKLQLIVPDNTMIEPVTFNRILSVTSATLVVLFALPLAVGLFTYLVPLQIGAALWPSRASATSPSGSTSSEARSSTSASSTHPPSRRQRPAATLGHGLHLEQRRRRLDRRRRAQRARVHCFRPSIWR